MRNYRPDYILCGISKYRYDELKAFCRQYGEKKTEAEALLSIGSPAMSGMPHETGNGDPVFKAVARRERLLADCEAIEQCAKSVDNGRFYTAIIQNVCTGKAYKFLFDVLPTNNRTAFYNARRAFYVKLNDELEKRLAS